MATRSERDRRDEFDLADASRREALTGRDRPYLKGVPVPMWQPKSAAYTIDILPFKVSKAIEEFSRPLQIARPGQWYYEQSFFTHFGIGVNGETHLCMAKTFDKACPVCEERARLGQDPKTRNTKEVKDAVKALFWSLRMLVLVNDHDEKDQKNKGIQLWDVSNHAFGKQLDAKRLNARPELLDDYKKFYDPRGGYSLRVVFNDEPMGNGGSYLKANVDELIARKKGLPEDLVNHGICLTDLIEPADYNATKKVFTMAEAGGDREEASSRGRADERDAERPARGRDADEPRSRRGREPEPEPADAETFKPGDRVKWTYRGDDYTGEIDEINEDRGIAYCIDDADKKAKPQVVDLSELEIEEEKPARRGRTEEDDRPARGRGREDERDADEPRRGRGRAEDKPFEDKNGDADEPRSRRGRGRDEDEPEPTTARRGRGK